MVAALAMLAVTPVSGHDVEQPQPNVDYLEVYEKVEGVCSGYGRSFFLKNLSGTHWIEVAIEIKHYAAGNPRNAHVRQRFIWLRPAEKEEIGCTAYGSERNDYTVQNARWYDPLEDR